MTYLPDVPACCPPPPPPPNTQLCRAALQRCGLVQAQELPGKPAWDWQGLVRHARELLEVLEGGRMEDLLHRSTLGAALRRL